MRAASGLHTWGAPFIILHYLFDCDIKGTFTHREGASACTLYIAYMYKTCEQRPVFIPGRHLHVRCVSANLQPDVKGAFTHQGGICMYAVCLRCRSYCHQNLPAGSIGCRDSAMRLAHVWCRCWQIPPDPLACPCIYRLINVKISTRALRHGRCPTCVVGMRAYTVVRRHGDTVFHRRVRTS